MSHDDYFNQLQTESAIRSARLQIERAREMLRLSRDGNSFGTRGQISPSRNPN